MSPNEPVIPPHPTALGRHAFACQRGTEEERLAARRVLTAARVKDVALKQMVGTPPLTDAEIAEIASVLKGGA